jgi:uncharacterized membrane protein (UPF0182 family)
MPEFSIPIAVLLIPYALFVVFFLVYGAFTWYHLDRFGVMHGHLQMMRVVFVLGSLVLLAVSALALSRYDWTASVGATEITGGIDSVFHPL